MLGVVAILHGGHWWVSHWEALRDGGNVLLCHQHTHARVNLTLFGRFVYDAYRCAYKYCQAFGEIK